MQSPVYLEANQVPAVLRGCYVGKQFKAIVTEAYTIPADDGIWYEGSRHVHYIVETATGRKLSPVDRSLAPWDGERKAYAIKMEPGYVVVRESMYRGKDMGLTFYVHPSDVAAVLPKPETVELSDAAKVAVWVAACYISKARKDYAARNGFPAVAYEQGKQEAIAAGMLDKRGAVTVKGQNYAETLRGKFKRY